MMQMDKYIVDKKPWLRLILKRIETIDNMVSSRRVRNPSLLVRVLDDLAYLNEQYYRVKRGNVTYYQMYQVFILSYQVLINAKLIYKDNDR
jgi:hypothetical protein